MGWLEMFKQAKRLVRQTEQDVKAVQNGDLDGALKKRGRPIATKNAPGGSFGRRLIGKFFR